MLSVRMPQTHRTLILGHREGEGERKDPTAKLVLLTDKGKKQGSRLAAGSSKEYRED